MTDWSRELRLLRKAGAALEPGLSEAELALAEQHCGSRFPPDLRDFLRVALPTGERFPDWRDHTSAEIEQALTWPFEGIAFDIEHNAFWWPTWGSRPASLEDAIAVAREQMAEAPRLIPIFSHRYLPATPCAEGNPVFSVYQTDVIYYGRDLRAYIAHEFGPVDYARAITPEPRHIPFWSDLVENNGVAAG